jgi:hypothetical protein
MKHPSTDGYDGSNRDFLLVQSDAARRRRSRLWILAQILAAIPFLYATSIVLEMSFAQPGVGYIAPNGRSIQCEALAPGKRLAAPRCATFGSKETSPVAYVLAIASASALGALLWASTRRGRGLRLSRHQ